MIIKSIKTGMRIVVIFVSVVTLLSVFACSDGKKTKAVPSISEDYSNIEWNLDNIKILNQVAKASIYKVSADINTPLSFTYVTKGNDLPANTYKCSTADDKCFVCPNGYGVFNSNILHYLMGGGHLSEKFAQMDQPNHGFRYVDRGLFNLTTNSVEYIDSTFLPQEIVQYSQDIKLYSKIVVRELYGDDVTDKMLKEWYIDLPQHIEYPIKLMIMRLECDGIPISPYEGQCDNNGRIGYEGFFQGVGYSFETGTSFSITDGKNAYTFNINGHNIEKTDVVCSNEDVIPFEEIISSLKEKIAADIGRNNQDNSEVVQKITDVKVDCAELCYILFGFGEDDDNCEDYYLAPYWCVYYSCGHKDGRMLSDVVAIPAIQASEQ